MKYSYNLLKPSDYLKLLYSSLFDWGLMPSPKKWEETLILLIQSLVLLFLIAISIVFLYYLISFSFHPNFCSEYFSCQTGILRLLSFLYISCIFVGLIQGIANSQNYDISKKKKRDFKSSLALGLVASITTMCLQIILIFAMYYKQENIYFLFLSFIFSIPSVGIGFLPLDGLRLDQSIFVNSRILSSLSANIFLSWIITALTVSGLTQQSELGFPLISNIVPETLNQFRFNPDIDAIISAITYSVILFIVYQFFVVSLIPGGNDKLFLEIESHPKKRLAKQDLIQGVFQYFFVYVVILVFGSFPIILFKIEFKIQDMIGLTLTFFILTILSTRFPLWIIESIWALGVSYVRKNKKYCVEDVKITLRIAYFDHHTPLPFPGEEAILNRLWDLDQDVAIQQAIKLAKSSGHLLAATSALTIFAKSDPLKVHSSIWKTQYIKKPLDIEDSAYSIRDQEVRNRLLAYVGYDLSGLASKVWQAQQKFNQIINQTYIHDQDILWIKNIYSLKPHYKNNNLSLLQKIKAYIKRYKQIKRRDKVVKTSQEKWRLPYKDYFVVASGNKAWKIISREFRQAIDDFESLQELYSSFYNFTEFSKIYNLLLELLEFTGKNKISSFIDINEFINDSPIFFSIPALNKLNSIITAFNKYQETTSPIIKRDIILQAQKIIKELEQSLDQDSPTLVDAMLKIVEKKCENFITKEVNVILADSSSDRIPNPYVINNPVKGEFFIGREDIFTELEGIWCQQERCTSVVLYGHRRMGKSSILHNLGTRFGQHTVIVDFNMQRIGRVKSNEELIFNLARKIHRSWCQQGYNNLAEPKKSFFLEDNPYIAFDEFLLELEQVRNRNRFIITVDEFEWIEKQINSGQLDPYLLDHWRGTFETYPWFIMAFAGQHSLEEMRRDYWSPLYGSVKAIKVSFLSPFAAKRLITYPSFIDYDEPAIQEILNLTNGQPYLIQLICHSLVTRFNRQTFEEGNQRERRFYLEDVEAVINSMEFIRDGNAYFEGVWQQAKTTEPPEQPEILKQLCNQEMSMLELVEATHLTLEQVQAALRTLLNHDVVTKYGDNKYRYTVPLMKQWVKNERI